MPVDRDPTRNEPIPKRAPNHAPSGEIENPIELGRAGRRLVLDRVLRSVEGFGKEQLAAAGVQLRDVARYRDELATLLAQVIQYDGRRASRQRERAAAMRILGHAKIVEGEPLLTEIVASRDEDPRQRAAAADALGLMRAEGAVGTLVAQLHDSHPVVRESAARALGVVAPVETITELKTIASRMDDPRALEIAIRAIETRHGGGKAVEPPGKARPGRRSRLTRLMEIPAFDTSGPGALVAAEADRPRGSKARPRRGKRPKP